MDERQLIELFNIVGCACVYTLNRYHAIKEEHIESKTVKEGAHSVIIVDQHVLDTPPDPTRAIDNVAYGIGRMLGHALSNGS
jgi:vacuolar-type H+-ATPase subunit F/Vma7